MNRTGSPYLLYQSWGHTTVSDCKGILLGVWGTEKRKAKTTTAANPEGKRQENEKGMGIWVRSDLSMSAYFFILEGQISGVCILLGAWVEPRWWNEKEVPLCNTGSVTQFPLGCNQLSRSGRQWGLHRAEGPSEDATVSLCLPEPCVVGHFMAEAWAQACAMSDHPVAPLARQIHKLRQLVGSRRPLLGSCGPTNACWPPSDCHLKARTGEITWFPESIFS